ncbi:histidinol phosphate aminotransferase 1 [Tanacetum coccineum]
MKFPYIYPDPKSHTLCDALAHDSGLEFEYILVGCRVDELINLIMLFVRVPGENIIDCPPAFTMYEFDAAVNCASVIKVRIMQTSQENSQNWANTDTETEEHTRDGSFSSNGLHKVNHCLGWLTQAVIHQTHHTPLLFDHVALSDSTISDPCALKLDPTDEIED